MQAPIVLPPPAATPPTEASSEPSKTPLVVAAFVVVAVLAGGIGWLIAGRGGDQTSTEAAFGGEDRPGTGLVEGDAPIDRDHRDAGPDGDVTGGLSEESDTWRADTTVPYRPPTTRPRTTSTTTSTTIPEPTASATLQQLRDEGRQDLAAYDGNWFPQISSKFVGLEADGIVYDDEAILANHLRLVEEQWYDHVVLVWSGDFSTFDRSDAWVSVVVSPSPTPDPALAWCDMAAMGPDDCFGKRIGNRMGPGETTAYRR